jgi:hypothetical protein
VVGNTGWAAVCNAAGVPTDASDHAAGVNAIFGLYGSHHESSPMPSVTGRDRLAVAAGAIRLASGISFLVAPEAASVLWGSDPDGNPTASLLLRSMGYRDALVGGMLLRAGLQRDRTTVGWFLASAGADLADLIGGIANHDRLPARSRSIGLGGAVIGIVVGVVGSARAARWLRIRP